MATVPPPQPGAVSEVRCPHCAEPHPASYSHCPKTGKALYAGEALVGRVFANRYRIVGLLGEGGMGAVYVAEHLLIGRKVAIKRLHPELAADEKAVRRFQREARTAASTGHDNIVEVLDLGWAEDGAPFLVMEYLRGESLAATLRREGRLAPARACHIVGQVLAALAAVHRKQIVHRDLKPDNVFLTRRGGRSDYVKVLDFGVSKVRAEDGDPLDLTRTGVMLGTPYYMSPEQARGVKTLDGRVDIYATGVILYEALAGRLPFNGDNYHQLLQAILAGKPERIETLAPDVPRDLADAVHRAIAKDRDERFVSVHEMARALVPFGAALLPEEPDDASWRPPSPATAAALRATTPADVEDTTPREPTEALEIAATSVAQRTPGGKRPSVPPANTFESKQVLARAAGLAPPPRQMSAKPRRFVAASSDWREPLGLSPVAAATDPSSGVREQVAKYGGAWSMPAKPPDPEPTPRPSAPPRASAPPDAARATLNGDAQVKGSLLLAALDHLERAFGRGGQNRVIATLTPEVRARLGGVILPVAWFPLDTYDALLAGAEKMFGHGDGALAADVGASTATRDLPTTHRLFIQSATPAMAVERLPQIWRTYHSRGRVSIDHGNAGGFRVEVHDLFPDTFLHAMAMTGFYRQMLELAGAREPRVTLLASRGRGDERTVTAIRFR